MEQTWGQKGLRHGQNPSTVRIEKRIVTSRGQMSVRNNRAKQLGPEQLGKLPETASAGSMEVLHTWRIHYGSCACIGVQMCCSRCSDAFRMRKRLLVQG